MSLRKRIAEGLRDAIPPSARSELDWFLQAMRTAAAKTNPFQWSRARLNPTECTHPVIYFGTAGNREVVELHLCGRALGASRHHEPVVVSDLPLPGSLRLPRYVQPTVPLAQPLESIMDGYGEKLRRVVRQQLSRVRVVKAEDDALVRFADKELLRPYASSRYGPAAAQLDSRLVEQIATRRDGRLDLIYSGDDPVACHLGMARVRRGKRHWLAVRFGFAKSVFTHPKRLHEINSVNVHLAIQHAKDQGFDFYNLGDCLARPDDGLLHWKRRRGGGLSAEMCQEWFYVRLPRTGRADFLWTTPLFSAGWRGRNLSLHIGIPHGRTDDEVLTRYREMSFAGLTRLVIHHERPVGPALREGLAALYLDTGSMPRFELHAISGPSP